MTPQERNLSDVPWQVAAKLGRFFIHSFSTPTFFLKSIQSLNGVQYHLQM